MMHESQSDRNEDTQMLWWKPVVTILPLFLITRVTIFCFGTSATDAQIYHQYALAVRQGSVADLYKQYPVEYPQLATLFGVGVETIADCLPPGVERLIPTRESSRTDIPRARFEVALGLVLFGIDAGLLLLIARLARHNPSRQQKWQLGLYVAGTAALGPIMYDRLDLVVGALALVGVVLLGSGRSLLSYVVLTVGVGFKLVPLILFPIFVVTAAAQRGDRFWRSLARETALAFLILALWPVLAYEFGGGERAFVYLNYHSARGPELGSVYAAPLLLAGDAEVGYIFNSFAVRSSLSDVVGKRSPYLVIVALAAAFFVYVHTVRKSVHSDWTPVVAGGCILILLSFILTNKVGSPQYLLWVAPLVPLLPMASNSEQRWGMLFVLSAILATMAYPFCWRFIHGTPVPDQPGTWEGPTPFGFMLLFLRWALVMVMIVWLGLRLWKCSSLHRADVSLPNPSSVKSLSGNSSALEMVFQQPTVNGAPEKALPV
jgi:hypothetical protein